MLAYTIRRLLKTIPTILAVATVIFVAIRVMGGDPATVLLGDAATEDALRALRQQMGLNRPLWEQYLSMLKGLVVLDLGNDLFRNQPVIELLKLPLMYTLELTCAATMIGVSIGVPLGILAAVRHRSLIDSMSRVTALLGFSFPGFFTGMFILYIFGFKLHWFPMMGGGNLSDIPDSLNHLVLPAFTLGIMQASFIMRLTRSTMLNTLRENYVITARAKGLRERVVVYKHALRNALIPVVTMLSAYIAFTLGGSIVLEIIYQRPGIGKHLIGAISERNYPVIQGGLILFSAGVVIINLITDLIYSFIDPRITYE